MAELAALTDPARIPCAGHHADESGIWTHRPEDVRRIAADYLGTEAMTIAITGDRAVIDAQIAPFGTATA